MMRVEMVESEYITVESDAGKLLVSPFLARSMSSKKLSLLHFVRMYEYKYVHCTVQYSWEKTNQTVPV